MKKLSKARTQKFLDDFSRAATNFYIAQQQDSFQNEYGWALATSYELQRLKQHFGEDGFSVCTDTENQRVYAKLKGA